MLDRDRMIQILDNHRYASNIASYKNVADETLLTVFNELVVNDLYSLLKTGWVGVKFLKVSGEERNMVCTLSPAYLPSRETEEVAVVKQDQDADANVPKPRKVNPDVIRVWDRDVEGWRSFRLDSIEQVWKLEPIIMEK